MTERFDAAFPPPDVVVEVPRPDEPPRAWVDYLSLEDVLEIAAGVVGQVTVRDIGLLASTADRPRMSVFGEDAYPSLTSKAAALMESIARNHTLMDGNKRLAWAATRIFLLMNNRDLNYSVDDAETLVLSVAPGQFDVVTLAADLEAHLI